MVAASRRVVFCGEDPRLQAGRRFAAGYSSVPASAALPGQRTQ